MSKFQSVLFFRDDTITYRVGRQYPFLESSIEAIDFYEQPGETPYMDIDLDDGTNARIYKFDEIVFERETDR